MKEIIRINSFPIKTTLSILLQDKTTKKNIIWATGSYASLGNMYRDTMQITEEALLGLDSILLQPRILKEQSEQQERTRKKAEVFTPSWICNKMNNYCDEDWFGRKEVFNVENGNSWATVEGIISFPRNKTWKQYVDSRRLEITCGEAPFLVSRYDAATGEYIPIPDRVGVLDRKLRIVCENTNSKDDWFEWAIRAFQSVYGYEYQGDNLLIGRMNLLMTFVEYYEERFNRLPDTASLNKVANIISWNLWQMDGLSGTVPLGAPEEKHEQLSLFTMFDEDPIAKETTPLCKIYDWRRDNSQTFESLKERFV